METEGDAYVASENGERADDLELVEGLRLDRVPHERERSLETFGG